MQSMTGPASPRTAMVVTAVAVVLALIGVVGIAVGAGDNDDDKISSTGATTTTDLGGFGAGDAGGSGSDTTFAGTATTVASGAATTVKPGTVTTVKPTATTVTADCPNPPAASADPVGHQPPAIGTFTYVSCSDSSDTSDTKISSGNSGNGVTRRTVSNSESGFDQTATLAYGPNGVLLESLRVKSPQGDLSCDWNPDVVNYPPAMSVGAQWNTKSSCDLKQSNGASPGKLNLDASGKVTGKVAYTVGGTTVNAWVVEGTIKLTTSVAFGTSTATITQRSYYSPAHGLDVYRHSESQTQQGNTVRDERLQSLTPKSS